MNAVKNTDQSVVLMKAFNNACVALGFENTEKSKLLGVNESILSRNAEKGFLPRSKMGELQLHFINLYRSLFAISGGDGEFMLHWFHTKNQTLNGIPASLCLSIEGLFRTNQYLDAMQSFKPIKTVKDNEVALARIEVLWDALPNTVESDELEMLITQVHAFEEENYAIDAPIPIEAVKFRLEQQDN